MMLTQMIVRIEPDLKDKASRLAKAEGKNLSELVRDLLASYTKQRDMSAYVDSIWERIGGGVPGTTCLKLILKQQ